MDRMIMTVAFRLLSVMLFPVTLIVYVIWVGWLLVSGRGSGSLELCEYRIQGRRTGGKYAWGGNVVARVEQRSTATGSRSLAHFIWLPSAARDR